MFLLFSFALVFFTVNVESIHHFGGGLPVRPIYPSGGYNPRPSYHPCNPSCDWQTEECDYNIGRCNCRRGYERSNENYEKCVHPCDNKKCGYQCDRYSIKCTCPYNAVLNKDQKTCTTYQVDNSRSLKHGVYLVKEKLNFNEAFRKCLYQGAVIVDIHGKDNLNDALFRYFEYTDEPIWVRNSVVQNCILIKDKTVTFTDCDEKHYFACYGVAGYPTQYSYKFTNEKAKYDDAAARCDLAVIKNIEMLAHVYKSIPEAFKRKEFFLSSNTRNYAGRWMVNQNPAGSRGECVVLEDGEYKNVNCWGSYGRICQTPIKSFEDRCAKTNCPGNNCFYNGREFKCDCGKDKKFDETKNECVADHCKTAKCSQICNNGICSCAKDFALDGKKCIHKHCLSSRCTVRCNGEKCGCNPGYELNNDGRTCTKYIEPNMVTKVNGLLIMNVQKSQRDADYFCRAFKATLLDVTNMNNLQHEVFQYIKNKKHAYWIKKEPPKNPTDRYRHGELCFFIKDDEVISSDDCYSSKFVICKSSVAIPPPLKAGINVVNVKKSFDDAYSYCLYRGAVLFDIGENMERKSELKNLNLASSETYIFRKSKACQSVYNNELSTTGCSAMHYFICRVVDDSLSPYRYKVTMENQNFGESKKRCDIALVDNIETEALIYRNIPELPDYAGRAFMVRTSEVPSDGETCAVMRNGKLHQSSHGCGYEGRVCQVLNKKFQDECAKKNCPNKRCKFERGSLECSCQEKFVYHKDKNICLPKNDCSEEKENQCSHYCSLEDGKFVCLCPTGMFLDKHKKTCHDLNKICDFVDHGCDQICKPHFTSFKCDCKLGYLLQSDKKTCKAGYDARMFRYQAIGFHSYNFDAARKLCESRNMKLASIHSQEEANYIKNIVVAELFFKSRTGEYWIGLSDRRRKTNDWAWIDGTPLDFKNWKKGEPNGGNNENCAALEISSNQWNDIDCGREFSGVICKRQVIADCNQCQQQCIPEGDFYTCACKKGYLLKSDGRTCQELFDVDRYVYSVHYEFIGSKHSYESAKRGCQNIGADLAKITHQIEQDYIFQMVKDKSFFLKVSEKNLYIGLTDKKKEREFRWEDDSLVNYTNWANNEPNNANGDEHCVAMVSNTGLWNDINCNTQADGYICKRKNHCFNNFCKNGGICRQNNFQAFCSCKSGLVGPRCERDINECEMFPLFCQNKCSNTVGSFKCSCPKDYEIGLYQKICHEKGDVCAFTHHGCEVCIDKGNKKYECGCKPGYKLNANSKTCSDVDECKQGLCGNRACRNVPGSYYCECDIGMDMKENGPHCEKYSAEHTVHYISTEKLSFWDAAKYCESRNGYLTGVSGDEETKSITKRLEKNKAYWIGLYKDSYGWKWVKGAFKYRNWMASRPVSTYRDQFVTIKYDSQQGYKWFDVDHDEKNYFICKLPKNFQWIPQHYRYIKSTEKLNWNDASSQCQKQDSSLLRVQNKEEQAHIEQGLKFQDTQYWIGLQQTKATKNVLWSTGARLGDYKNLMETVSVKTSDYCAVLGKNLQYKWKMVPCVEKNNYICKKLYFNHGPYKFYISHVRMSFERAKQFCYSYEGQLVSYSDQSEESFLDWTLIKDKKYWIGAIKSGDKWKWLDGSKFEYVNWKYEQSDKTCATKVFSKGLFVWQKTDCNDYAYAICKVDFIREKQYKYLYEDAPHSWSEANAYCKRHNGELANIVDGNIYKLLISKGIETVKYWVGYNKRISTDRWSDKSLVIYNNFAKQQSGNCAWFEKSSSTLQFGDCTLRKALLCKIREFPFDNYDYHFVREKLSWEHARMKCWKMGGELTSISKTEELLFDEHMRINEEFWHGLYKYNEDLVWVGGSKSSYRNLNEYDRVYDKQCVYIKKQKEKKSVWMIGDCSYSRYFICKVPRYQTKRYKYYLSQSKVDKPQAERICTSFNGELLGMRTEEARCLKLTDKTDKGDWLIQACGTDMVFACKIDKFSPYNHTYINRPDVTIPWKDAVQYCIKDIGNLISITSKEGEMHMASLMEPNVNYWTGLKRLSNEWKWSDDETIDYIPNIKNVRNNYCVSVRKTTSGKLEWQTLSCTSTARVICKAHPYYNSEMFKYYTTSNRRSIVDARYDCLKNGYELVSIISKDEIDHMKKGLSSTYKTWIGATNFILISKYDWYDGQRTDYQNWLSEFPHYNQVYCVGMDSNGLWSSQSCSNTNLYMCRKRVKGVWAIYGNTNKPAACLRKPCRNLGQCSVTSGSDFKCTCKTGFDGKFCGDGATALASLKTLYQTAFEKILDNNHETAKKDVSKSIKLIGNECKGNEFELYCKIENAKTILKKILSAFTKEFVDEPKAAILSWMLVHDIEIKDEVAMNKVMKSVLGLIYKYVSNNDDVALHRLSKLQPKVKIDILISTGTLRPLAYETKDIVKNALKSVSTFLAAIQRSDSKTKVVVSRYDIREKLKLTKLDSISHQIEISSLEIKKELHEFADELKDFIFKNNAARFAALGDYFAEVAKFDNEKNLADVGYADGRLKDFKKKLDEETSKLSSNLRKVTIVALSATVADVAEYAATMIVEVIAGMNPFKLSKQKDFFAALNKVAQAGVGMAQSIYLFTTLQGVLSLMSNLQKQFQDNKKNIDSMNKLIDKMKDYFGKDYGKADKVADKELTTLVNEFMRQYRAYGPQVSKEELADLGEKLDTYYDEGCDLLYSSQGVAAAVVETTAGSLGYCADGKNVATVMSLLNEVHDYQYDMIESLAVVTRSFIAIQQALKLKKNFNKEREKPKTSKDIAKFRQKALSLVMTSRLSFLQNIYQYCDYREYSEGGIRPVECTMAISKLTDNSINNLIALHENYCSEERTAVALIPTFKGDTKSNDYLPLDKLYAGEEIEFQIKSIMWLVRHNWISPFSPYSKAYYLKEFNLLLPDTHSTERSVTVTTSWSDTTHLFPSQMDRRYILDKGSYRFEYRQNAICSEAEEIKNVYETCENVKVRLCRVSLSHNVPVYPSIFTKFKIKVRFNSKDHGMKPHNFATKFYLKADISLCQIRNDKIKGSGKLYKRVYYRRPECCQKPRCSNSSENKYWKLDAKDAVCSSCPDGSKVSSNGYFCFKK